MFNTNLGNIIVNIWDLNVQEETDGAIIMFDTTSLLSLKNTLHWREKSSIDSSSTIDVGSKIDLPMNDKIKGHEGYYPISSKSGEGLIESMEGLLSQLMGEKVTIL